MRLATMAGVTGYARVAIERVRINAVHHFQHFSGYHFFVLVIAREVTLNVAIHALHSRTRNKSAHDGADFFRFNDLKILRSTHAAPAALTAARRWRILRHRGKSAHGK